MLRAIISASGRGRNEYDSQYSTRRSALHDAAQCAMLAVGDVVHTPGGSLSQASWLASHIACTAFSCRSYRPAHCRHAVTEYCRSGHHMRQTGNKDFIVRSEQTLWRRIVKRVCGFACESILITSCWLLCCGQTRWRSGEGENLLNIAMVVIIEVQGGGRDMNKVRTPQATAHSPRRRVARTLANRKPVVSPRVR